MQQDLRTELRKDIEAMIQRHPGGLTAKQIAERTGADIGIVRSIIGRLRDRLYIRATKPGSSATSYQWAGMVPSKATPDRINRVFGDDYIPSRDNPTSPRRPGSDQHEQFGSRFGNRIVPYKP